MDLAQRIVEKLQKGFCVRQQTRRHFKEADPNRVTQINLQSLEDAIIGYALGQKSLGPKYFLCVSISITYFIRRSNFQIFTQSASLDHHRALTDQGMSNIFWELWPTALSFRLGGGRVFLDALASLAFKLSVTKWVTHTFSDLLALQSLQFLAVQTRVWDSSIPTPVTTSLTTRTFYFLTSKSDPRDLWPLRHMIRVIMRHDLTKRNIMTKTNTKTKTMTKTNTFREHLQRAILETFDLWDIRSEWWGDMAWPKKDNDKDKDKDKDNDRDKYI